ncbi:MAG: hypothetical protein R2682_03435 [Pyrinomonadaceae bacterium]
MDTNFVIQFMNEGDERHREIRSFFRIFQEKAFRLKFSTISIAEYCVRGKLDELPLRHLEVMPFNVRHAKVAGEFTRWFRSDSSLMDSTDRSCIKDDAKLLAQLQTESELTAFATSDKRLLAAIAKLMTEGMLRDILVLDTNYDIAPALGMLPFSE